jgi:hypothetical protein
MKKLAFNPYSFLAFLSILLTTCTVQAQDFEIQSDLSLPVLTPQLSADGLSLRNGVPPQMILADPNPAMQGLHPSGTSATQPVASTFSMTFLEAGQHDLWGQSCGAFPEEAKTAFHAATAIWATTVKSTVPITITACWANLSSATVLGYSGGGSLFRDFSGAQRSNTWYSKSLADSMAGTDLDPSSQDMYITCNSGFSWYYGTDGNPPAGQYDLETVAAHGIAQGLNFSGSAGYSNGAGSYGYGTGFPNIYDVFVEQSQFGTHLTSFGTSAELGTALTSGDLWFNATTSRFANDFTLVKIYAPSSWAAGSSYSHLDYNTFAGTSNSLMVYALGSGSAIHDPGPVTAALLEDLGWAMASDTFIVSGLVWGWEVTGPLVEGALVSVAGKTATTNSSGIFTITGIPAGTYTLTISKAGYDTYTDAAFVVNGLQRPMFVLTGPPLSISGTISLCGWSGVPMEGASVSMAGQTTTTDSSGAFSITGISGGTYLIAFYKEGYGWSINTKYHLYSSQSGLNSCLAPSIPFSLSGSVLVGDATGTPLAGATVAIAGKTAMTDSTGAFSITEIPAGSYTLTVSRQGYLTTTTTGYIITNNQTGRMFSLLPVQPRSYTMSGTVRQGSATGTLLGDASITIAGKTAVTDCKGTFKLGNIPAGSYTLTVSRKGYLTATTTGYVVAGNQSGLVFSLQPVKPSCYKMGGTLVRDRAGGPALEGATVAIAGKSAKTDRKGGFEIEKIPAGSYTLTISKAGYRTSTTTGFVINRNLEGLVFPLKHN